MKTKDFSKKLLVALTLMLALAMNAKAQKSTQDKRVMAFQTVMAMHDTTYKNLIKDGKYKEAIAPLTKLINILDTTTICQDTEISPEMIKAAKADYLYDQACCFALTSQKKLALATLGKSVDSGQRQRPCFATQGQEISGPAGRGKGPPAAERAQEIGSICPRYCENGYPFPL